MPHWRIKFRIATSYGTAFQADTIFGHFCWAIRHLEGEDALGTFLSAYDSVPVLLVSDAFPLVGDRCYLPRPKMPVAPEHVRALAAKLNVSIEDRALYRKFSSALKSVERVSFVELAALTKLADGLKPLSITQECFELRMCPKSMAERDPQVCGCTSWTECPALNTGSESRVTCHERGPVTYRALTMHNVVNRWTNSAANLFAQEDAVPDHWVYFLASADGTLFTEDLLKKCMEYLEHSGFGRDSSTGRGAIKDCSIEEFHLPAVPGADAFVNLSSAYVPRQGELAGKTAWYMPHIKRGKLGGDYVLTNSPWKKPVMMLGAGAVINDDPSAVHGCLVKNIHRELSQVVQYGYAYPLGVRLDA